MGRNFRYLTADRTSAGDEVYTPFYAVEPLLEFLPKDKKIWCPFDEEWSAFYQFLSGKGYEVERSSLKEGQDFFRYHRTLIIFLFNCIKRFHKLRYFGIIKALEQYRIMQN